MVVPSAVACAMPRRTAISVTPLHQAMRALLLAGIERMGRPRAVESRPVDALSVQWRVGPVRHPRSAPRPQLVGAGATANGGHRSAAEASAQIENQLALELAATFCVVDKEIEADRHCLTPFHRV